MKEGKSFEVSQKQVLEAYKRVKANQGAAGIDGVTFVEYEKDLKNNLYTLWNRMASGSYFPKAVRGVEIPKKNGKKRLLGIPTITDRVAQMVVTPTDTDRTSRPWMRSGSPGNAVGTRRG
jgi:RNA-directed DNA polymerase